MAQGAPPVGRVYQVAGRGLMLHHVGTGRPAVVVEAGGGNFGLDYLNIHAHIARFTTCVVYDRAGYGWSDPVEQPRSATAVNDDLRGLLAAAAVPAPYILVGHSLGGLYVRRYAQRFPGEVAGLVLVDPDHEDIRARMPAQWQEMEDSVRAQLDRPPAPLSEEQLQQARGWFGQIFSTWPASVREPLIDRHLDAQRARVGLEETRDWHSLYAEVQAGGDLPNVPLIVLTGAALDPWPVAEQVQRELIDTKRNVHAALAASTPHGQHRILDDVGHMITTHRPDAVVNAVHDIVTQL